jgi:hypothetical protein
METCRNCGRLVDYVDITLYCDDCNYNVELEIMAEREAE